MAFKIPNFSKQMGGSPFKAAGDTNSQKPPKRIGETATGNINYNFQTMNAILDHHGGRFEQFRGANKNKINPASPNSQAMRDAYKADWGKDFDPQNEDAINYASSYYGSQEDAFHNVKQLNPDMSNFEARKESRRLRDSSFGQGGENSDELQNVQDEANVSRNPYTGFGSDAWNNNFTIENGQRVDKYGNTYSDDAEGFASFQEAARSYNSNKKNNNVEVLDTDNVNIEEEVEPIENVVNPNAHVPSEGIQIISGKQRRAAKRVARLRNKAAKKGGLTESQSKRLNRNIDKAQGDEVAFSDKTKIGQVISKAGDALGITSEEEVV